jgi:hypothetical protein
MRLRSIAPLSLLLCCVLALLALSTAAQERVLIKGSKACVQERQGDTLTFSYRDFTITTYSQDGNAGEQIFVQDHARKKEYPIVSGSPAQYFYGISGNTLFIDEGTSVIRTLFVFDMDQVKMCDTIDRVLDYVEITDGKLSLKVMMDPERVIELKLPLCDNPEIEVSGYIEEVFYDLKLHTNEHGTYECLK